MAVDVDQRAAEVAAGEQKRLTDQREDKGGSVDAAVFVSRPAGEPAGGEDGGRCQHGDQMQVRQLALWRSGGRSRRSSRPVSIVGGAKIRPAEIASSAPWAMAG